MTLVDSTTKKYRTLVDQATKYKTLEDAVTKNKAPVDPGTDPVYTGKDLSTHFRLENDTGK